MNICPYCTTQNNRTAKQCSNCGVALADAVLALRPSSLLFSGSIRAVGILGRGGFGITYRGIEVKTGKGLAIKECFPDGAVTRNPDGSLQPIPGFEQDFAAALKRFQDETKVLAELKHRSATKLLHSWNENNTAYMAMELIPGHTLERRILKGQTLSEAEALHVLSGVSGVLQELHAKKLLHRDIKPANIIMQDDVQSSHVELIDYGSVTSFTPGKRVRVTSRLLTPEYAPLEQFGTEVLLGPGTDFYALGATLYEAVTLRKPAQALERANGEKLETIWKINPSISPFFSVAIAGMMAMHIKGRPKIAKELQMFATRVKANQVLQTNFSFVMPKSFAAIGPYLLALGGYLVRRYFQLQDEEPALFVILTIALMFIFPIFIVFVFVVVDFVNHNR